MHTWEAKFYLGNSSTPHFDEVKARSEHEARQLIEARYSGEKIRIIVVKKID